LKIHLIKTIDLKNKKELLKEKKIKDLIKSILKYENKKLGEINIILQSDKEELSINKKFLKHNYYTDVIAFKYNRKSIVSGDIFISVDNVKRNAKKYNEEMKKELLRVIIHGILHLIGYDDKEKREKEIMSEKEEFYLNTALR
jgi:rRNA maturation RNase YbeY